MEKLSLEQQRSEFGCKSTIGPELLRRLRIRADDLIHRHDFDLRFPLVKFNCADDADVFALQFCDLVSRNSRISRNEPGKRLVWVFSSEIDKGGT
jgi:hypothetical protein